LGAARFRLLESHFAGDMARAWDASLRELRAAGVGGSVAQAIVKARDTVVPERELEILERAGVAALSWNDQRYPARLKETVDAPPVLYFRGTLSEDDEAALAVVGTRRPTDYGYRVTGDLCAALAHRGLTIVSGLALGIDTRAHRATLDAGGRTVAVLGNGLDTVYPRENARLADRIISEGGAVISEFALGARPEASNFPRRNRIISGITLGTLITEAGETSGTRWTVYHALEQNREIFCVPGSIYSETSKLTNRLIREGAKLVNSVNDILVEIGLDAPERQIAFELDNAGPLTEETSVILENENAELPTAPVVRVGQQAPVRPKTDDPQEANILQHISEAPLHIDDLARVSDRPVAEVSGLLTMLELKGLVRQVGSMHYQLAN
jgi:DNA processing protein